MVIWLSSVAYDKVAEPSCFVYEFWQLNQEFNYLPN